jgi:hypothetical protein
MGGVGSRGVIGNRGNKNPKNPNKRTYSDKFKKSVQRALEKKAKETGKSIYDVFADQLYTVDKKQPQIWAANFKTLVEILVTKESKSTIEKHEYGPTILLPELEKDEEQYRPKELVH